MEKCHICGTSAEYDCRDCGEIVCDSCTMEYNQFTQIDWTQCKCCGDHYEKINSDIKHQEYLDKQKNEKERKEKNAKQREYYNSPSAIEKRRIIKENLLLKRRQDNADRAERLSNILGNIFKHL